MNGALMIRWGASIPGREGTSLDVFGSAINRFETLAKQGRIHGHREYFSVAGDFFGFMLIEGELDELMKILVEDDTRKLTDQASTQVQDFSVEAYAGGSDNATQELVASYMTTLGELGYMTK